MTNELATTLLHDPDPTVRRSAAVELGQNKSWSGELSSIIDALVGVLSDPHTGVQQAAVNALLTYDSQSVSERILPLLHGSVQHRSISIDILQQLGSQAVPSLLRALNDPDPHIRKILTDILGHIGCPASLSGLSGLMGDSSPNVRAAAAEALGHVGGDDSINVLMAAIDDPEEWVVFSVIHALGELRARQATGLLCRYLNSPDIAIQCAVVESLGKISDPDVLPDMLSILPTASTPLRHLLFVTIAALVGNQAEVFQRSETREYLLTELVEALRAREPEVQLAALKGIRLLGDSDATGALLEYLRHCDPRRDEIQTAVLKTLTKMGDEGQLLRAALDSEESVALRCIEALSSRRVAHAIPMLGKLVVHSDNREVRRVALIAIGELGVGACERVVVRALNDQSGYVRSEAARIVARAKLKSAHPVMVARLDEEIYSDVINELVRSLFQINSDKDLYQLEGLLLHPKAEVRAAVVAFWPCVDAETVQAILFKHLTDSAWKVRLSIVEKLTSLKPGEALRDAFFKFLSDPHPHVRQAAVIGLGAYQSASITEALCRTLRTDQDIWVRTHCVDQLVHMNERGASSLFLDLLPLAPIPLQISLARALGTFNYKLASRTLEALIFNDAEDVRMAASWALDQMKGQPRQTEEIV